MDMLGEIGLLDSVVPSQTSMADVQIYEKKGKFFAPFRGGKVKKLMTLLSNPVLLRTAMSNIRRKQIDLYTDDL